MINETEIKQFIEKRLTEHRNNLKKLQDKVLLKIDKLESNSEELTYEIENAVHTGLQELKVFKVILDNYILNKIQPIIKAKDYNKAVAYMFKIRDLMKSTILDFPYFQSNREEAEMLIRYLRLDMYEN